MSFLPISGQPIIINDDRGDPAQNHYIKFYKANTSQPIKSAANTTAQDESGNQQLLDKIRINSVGLPVNPNNAVIIPHVQQVYKIVLYRSAVDANADNINEAVWVVDNLAPGLIGVVEEDLSQVATDITYIGVGSTTERSVADKFNDMLSVKDFGAKGDGETDDTAAFVTALLFNLNIWVPSGSYLVDEVNIIKANQSLHFDSSVALKATSSNSTLLRQSSSGSHHTGHVTFLSNGFSGVTGVYVGPQPGATGIVDIADITMPSISGSPELSDLAVVQCGEGVGLLGSQNRNVKWPNVTGKGSTRVMWFRGAFNSSGTLPYGHQIVNFNSDSSLTNTGVQIDAGLGIEFLSFKCINVSSGGSPNSTATAFKLSETDSVTGDLNSYNKIHGGYIINCDRDLDVDSVTLNVGMLEYSDNNSNYGSDPIGRFRLTPKMDSAVYFGTVNSSGSSLKLPPGWSSTRSSEGQFRVTHNFGSGFYGAVATVDSDRFQSDRQHVCNVTKNSNYFDVATFENDSSDGEVYRNCGFSFIVSRY